MLYSRMPRGLVQTICGKISVIMTFEEGWGVKSLRLFPSFYNTKVLEATFLSSSHDIRRGGE